MQTKTVIHIFEFKVEPKGSAEDALKQIEEIGYADKYKSHGKKIIMIGTAFDEKKKTIGEYLIQFRIKFTPPLQKDSACAIIHPMKTLQRKIIFLTLTIFGLSFFAGCTTTSSAKNTKADSQKITVIERPERMFWEIKKGDARIFILGTFHFADKNFYPIEDAILTAFDNADYLVSEVGGEEEMKSLPAKLQAKILASMNLDPQKNLAKFLTKDEINLLYKEIGEQNIKPLFDFEPWILAMIIPEILYQKGGLNPASGIDLYFVARAESKKIEALETIEDQIEFISAGSFEEQLKRFYTAVDLLKNYNQAIEETFALKTAYLENNKKALDKILRKKAKSGRGLNDKEHQKFMDSIFKDRNIKWAKKFKSFLDRGGTTFVFAGAGHFVGEDSVQAFLLKMNK